jgi:hypothetical protein
MTPEQQAFYQRIVNYCDNIAARKSLSNQIDVEQFVLARILNILTLSQIEEAERNLDGVLKR